MSEQSIFFGVSALTETNVPYNIFDNDILPDTHTINEELSGSWVLGVKDMELKNLYFLKNGDSVNTINTLCTHKDLSVLVDGMFDENYITEPFLNNIRDLFYTDSLSSELLDLSGAVDASGMAISGYFMDFLSFL